MSQQATQVTGSFGEKVLQTIIGLLEENRTSDENLRHLDINSIKDGTPADFEPPVIYIEQLDYSAVPSTVGKVGVHFHDSYIYHIIYIHSRVNDDANNLQLTRAMDCLSNFFIEHSRLEGLSKGITVLPAKKVNWTNLKGFYRAVVMDIVVPVYTVKDRNK